MTSEFSADRVHPVTGVQRPHRGVDIATPDGTPLYAPADGIARTGEQDAAGQSIALDHDLDPTTRAFETKFFHLSDIAVEPGQRVQQGDLIGHTGHSGVGTGPHLHFEVWRDGEAIDPRSDPNMQWGLARDGDASAPTLAATANPGGELVAHRETHLPGSPAALLALLDAPAADGDYSAKPAWMAATGIAGRDWSEVSVRFSGCG